MEMVQCDRCNFTLCDGVSIFMAKRVNMTGEKVPCTNCGGTMEVKTRPTAETMGL